jgi:hypothetical protein
MGTGSRNLSIDKTSKSTNNNIHTLAPSKSISNYNSNPGPGAYEVNRDFNTSG